MPLPALLWASDLRDARVPECLEAVDRLDPRRNVMESVQFEARAARQTIVRFVFLHDARALFLACGCQMVDRIQRQRSLPLLSVRRLRCVSLV